VIGDNFAKINQLENQDFFNMAQQELSIYKHSMGQYQSPIAFDYYLRNLEMAKMQSQKVDRLEHNKIEFKNLTIEGYVQESILLPIRQVFQKTSEQLLCKYLMSPTPEYCQLQDQISLLHKVYFLQGVNMHKFLANLFDSTDKSQNRLQNQLYLINGHFQECLGELLDSQLVNLDRLLILGNMNVQFEDGQNMRSRARLNQSSLEYLQSIRVAYNCEWPVEIIIDKQTVHRKYNRIFKLLVHIKYAKYLMQKRDFHFKQPNLLRKSKSYSYSKNYEREIEEMGARERLHLQNQLMLGQLVHRVQVFQQELLHFITTMDDYFMNRATHLECMEFQKKIASLYKPKDHSDKLSNITPTTDLDDIIQMHDNYLGRIMQLCLLDTKSQELLRYIMEVVDICQQFRKLVRHYFLDSDNPDQNSDDEDEMFVNNDYSSTDQKSRSQKIEENFPGVGILRFNSMNFTQYSQECFEKLEKLRHKYKNHMMVLTTNLNKLTKTQSGKIILSYLLEILQRLNFNSYYVSRDAENLPPVRP